MREEHEEGTTAADTELPAHKHKTSRHKKPGRKVLRRIFGLSIPLFFIPLFWLLIIHFTPIRHRVGIDPIERSVEIVRLKTARSNVDYANAYLNISENRLRNFKASQNKSSKSGYQTKLVAEMIEQNKAAITYMDKAKKEGTDIKKKNLVKRLCDLLGDQSKTLAHANDEMNKLHTFAQKLEDTVDAGQDFGSAMEAVEKDLNAAMHW